jgi:hypothetical protein
MGGRGAHQTISVTRRCLASGDIIGDRFMGECAERLDEAEVKALVLGHLRRTGVIDAKTVIANEFRLGASPVRADLAISAGTFIGVEIKTDLDTLRRLPTQLNAYSRHFEQIIVVLSSRHARDLNLIAFPLAEVWTFDRRGRIDIIRTGTIQRPSAGYACLLNETELKRLRKLSANVELTCPVDRNVFVAAFESRYRKTSAKFWNAVRGRSIRADKLELLSRTHTLRTLQRDLIQARDSRREAWRIQAIAHLQAA